MAASRAHDSWGVRAIVVPPDFAPVGDGSGSGLVERWAAAFFPEEGAFEVGLTDAVALPGDAVVALGVTTQTELPLDVRFWRLSDGDLPRRIVPRPVPGPDPGSWLWLPDPVATTPLGSWAAGTYRIDVLLGARIVRLVTVVPTRAPGIAVPPTPLGRPDGLEALLAARPSGAFAIAGREVVAVHAVAGEPLDERTAWLEPGRDGRPAGIVGQVPSVGVTALGYVFPAGMRPVAADLELVAPVASRRFELDRFQVRDEEGWRWVAMLGPDGPGAMSTGLYRLTLGWLEGNVAGGGSWHFEILPRPPPELPDGSLDALRRWEALLVAADPAVDDEPLVTSVDIRPSRGRGTCGGAARITPDTRLIGVVVPEPLPVRIVLWGPDGTSRMDTRTAIGAVPGLALVALPRGLATGTYRLDVVRSVAGGGRGVTYDICVR